MNVGRAGGPASCCLNAILIVGIADCGPAVAGKPVGRDPGRCSANLEARHRIRVIRAVERHRGCEVGIAHDDSQRQSGREVPGVRNLRADQPVVFAAFLGAVDVFAPCQPRRRHQGADGDRRDERGDADCRNARETGRLGPQQDDRKQKPCRHRPQRRQHRADERRHHGRQHERHGEEDDQHPPIRVRRPQRFPQGRSIGTHGDPIDRKQDAHIGDGFDNVDDILPQHFGERRARVQRCRIGERRKPCREEPLEMGRQNGATDHHRNPWRPGSQIGPAPGMGQHGCDKARDEKNRIIFAQHGERGGRSGGSRPGKTARLERAQKAIGRDRPGRQQGLVGTEMIGKELVEWR